MSRRRSRASGCVVGLLVLTGCASPLAAQRFIAAPKMAFDDAAHRLERLNAVFPELDALAAAAVEKHAIPALALGIAVDGKLMHAGRFGVRDDVSKAPVDANTVFRIGSITKTFTALAVLKLRDEGQLELDAPAERYLPELARVTYPTRDSPRITIRHLLTHTSGLPAIAGFSYAQSDHDVTQSEILDSLNAVVLETPPGTTFAYSNLGLGLVGLIVGRVAGEPYRAYVTRAILRPLGMNDTRWSDTDVPPDHLARGHHGGSVVPAWRLGAFEGAGGLYTSLDDLSRYAAFELSAYPARDEAESGPVLRASVREGHQPTAQGRGLAWELSTRHGFPLVAHNGGTEGQSASLQLLPDHGIAVIVLSNISETEAPAEALALEVVERLMTTAFPRAFEITPHMSAAVKTLTDLYAGFTTAAYEKAFTSSFRAAATPAIVEASISELRSKVGLCVGKPEIVMKSGRVGSFAVTCEKGTLRYQVSLTVDGLIADADVQPVP